MLIDQTMVNDFRPFGAAMAKLSTNSKTIERSDGTEVNLPLALDKKRRIDTAFEVYLGLYQAITGPEERQKLFREFSPGFFDLIVIDECHRGSAAADSAWREILDHFSEATQIGLTATPKETEYVSNTDYFGAPAFTYSLRQGISDESQRATHHHPVLLRRADDEGDRQHARSLRVASESDALEYRRPIERSAASPPAGIRLSQPVAS